MSFLDLVEGLQATGKLSRIVAAFEPMRAT
jgi:hypothetical protein